MSGLMSYSGMTTKVRALKSNLVTKEQYRELSALSGVSDIAAFFKRHPAYQAIFAGINEQEIHRGEIEELLIQAQYRDFQKLYRFADMEQRKFLTMYYSQFEVAMIKRCLRDTFDKRIVPVNYRPYQAFFLQFSGFDLVDLGSSGSLEELIAKLKGTDYYQPLSLVYDSQKTTLYDYELALDLFYFSKQWKDRGKYLKGKDRELITQSLGTKIDLLNIQWVYRAKKFYHLTAADIYALVIPIHYKLKKTELVSLVEAETLEEFMTLVNATFYKKYEEMDSQGLEEAYTKILTGVNAAGGKHFPYSAAVINFYLYAKQQELDNLTTTLECIRYGMPTNEILKILKI